MPVYPLSKFGVVYISAVNFPLIYIRNSCEFAQNWIISAHAIKFQLTFDACTHAHNIGHFMSTIESIADGRLIYVHATFKVCANMRITNLDLCWKTAINFQGSCAAHKAV